MDSNYYKKEMDRTQGEVKALKYAIGAVCVTSLQNDVEALSTLCEMYRNAIRMKAFYEGEWLAALAKEQEEQAAIDKAKAESEGNA